jgi:hypothetical protein
MKGGMNAPAQKMEGMEMKVGGKSRKRRSHRKH